MEQNEFILSVGSFVSSNLVDSMHLDQIEVVRLSQGVRLMHFR